MFWGRLLRNVVLIIFPILIIINIVSFATLTTNGAVYEYTGFYKFFQNIENFPALEHTIGIFTDFYDGAMAIGHASDGWGSILGVLSMIGKILILPFNLIYQLLIDLCMNIAWFLKVLGFNQII